MARYRDEEHAEQCRRRAREAAARTYADPEKGPRLCARIVGHTKARMWDDRCRAIAHYGPTCRCCGEGREPFLVIDHINGGGNAHRQTLQQSKHFGRTGGGARLYAWLRQNGYPTGFQVLCANCNMAKDRLGGCPHQEGSWPDASLRVIAGSGVKPNGSISMPIRDCASTPVDGHTEPQVDLW